MLQFGGIVDVVEHILINIVRMALLVGLRLNDGTAQDPDQGL